jgi:hypothetical protein
MVQVDREARLKSCRGFQKEIGMLNKEDLMHMISEISSYVLETQPRRMVISLHQETDGLHLCVIDDFTRSDGELAAMEKELNSGARPELADYYGTMGGSDLVGTARLKMIGWQIKRADVERSGKGTKIDIWIGSDRFDSTPFTIPDGSDAN